MDALDKIQKMWEKGRYACIGLDSERNRLPNWALEEKLPQFAFNQWLIDRTSPWVAAYKPNMAFYEAEALNGLESLLKTIEYLRERHPNILTICDAKRADIGSTNEGYAKAIFGRMGFDAVTLNPYLGSEAMQPFLTWEGKICIMLCRTSNPGAGELQDLDVGGKPLWQVVAETVRDKWNTLGNCMLVAGATYPEELRHIRALVPEMGLLIPGFGTQGGTPEEAVPMAICPDEEYRIIANSSRAIIFAKDPASAAREFHQSLQKAMSLS